MGAGVSEMPLRLSLPLVPTNTPLPSWRGNFGVDDPRNVGRRAAENSDVTTRPPSLRERAWLMFDRVVEQGSVARVHESLG